MFTKYGEKHRHLSPKEEGEIIRRNICKCLSLQGMILIASYNWYYVNLTMSQLPMELLFGSNCFILGSVLDLSVLNLFLWWTWLFSKKTCWKFACIIKYAYDLNHPHPHKSHFVKLIWLFTIWIHLSISSSQVKMAQEKQLSLNVSTQTFFQLYKKKSTSLPTQEGVSPLLTKKS